MRSIKLASLAAVAALTMILASMALHLEPSLDPSLAFAADAPSATPTLPKLKANDPLPANLFIELAKAVNPSVVNIFTTYLPKRSQQRDPNRDPFFDLFEQFMGPQGQMQQAPQQALGTGFIIRADGLIVTNNHVIDRADVIKVQLEEGTKESFEAKLIGKDPRTDIALIKIETKRKLPFVKMGSSADVQVGEWVAAFGNPYGYGHSMTKGIISAIGREIDELNLNPFMQTDASINPGNSGGPLVNTQGLVIGVNTAIDARAQGIGFVIPIDNVKTILPTLEREGSIKRGFLGVNMADIDQDGAASLNLKQYEGALVTDVLPGSPAEKAGMKPYDLITNFADKKITSTHELTKAVIMTAVGTTVPIKVVRNGKPTSLKVTIGTPESVNLAKKKASQKPSSLGTVAPYQIGFLMAQYTPALGRELHVPPLRQARPVIVAIEPGTEASRAGLAPGDVILDVNRKEVTKVKEVVTSLRRSTINILRILKQDRVVLISIRAQ